MKFEANELVILWYVIDGTSYISSSLSRGGLGLSLSCSLSVRERIRFFAGASLLGL